MIVHAIPVFLALWLIGCGLAVRNIDHGIKPTERPWLTDLWRVRLPHNREYLGRHRVH